MLLACCYDTGYKPFLAEFAGDERLASRIKILQGGLPSELKTDFETVRLDGIFVGERSMESRVAPSGPKEFKPTCAGQYRHFRVGRFGPLVRDGLGKRIDRALSVSQEVYDKMAKWGPCHQGPCHWFYLKGGCFESSCSYDHTQVRLTDEEWDAVWVVARKGKCKQGRNCGDPMCIYGHR